LSVGENISSTGLDFVAASSVIVVLGLWQ